MKDILYTENGEGQNVHGSPENPKNSNRIQQG